jgi:hypothetical protein
VRKEAAILSRIEAALSSFDPSRILKQREIRLAPPREA